VCVCVCVCVYIRKAVTRKNGYSGKEECFCLPNNVITRLRPKNFKVCNRAILSDAGKIWVSVPALGDHIRRVKCLL
jgi:hypothetical protein